MACPLEYPGAAPPFISAVRKRLKWEIRGAFSTTFERISVLRGIMSPRAFLT